MKKEIIKYLNSLEVKDLSESNRSSDSGKWAVYIMKDNLKIHISNSKYEYNKIQISLSNKYDNFKTLVDNQDIKIFLETLRKRVEIEWRINTVSEEQRVELIDIFKKSKKIAKFFKETFVKIEGNEEKRFSFRNFEWKNDNEVPLNELNELKFHRFYVTELTRDKRLTNDFFSSKNYDCLISSKELCEIFDIDLEKEKKESFTKNFGFIFKTHEEKVSEDIKKEVFTEAVVIEKIPNKIKKIL